MLVGLSGLAVHPPRLDRPYPQDLALCSRSDVPWRMYTRSSAVVRLCVIRHSGGEDRWGCLFVL